MTTKKKMKRNGNEMNEGVDVPNDWMKFADLILQKCSERDFFLQFLCETELSPQSRAHLADLILQECSEHVRFYVFI